jgi:hypothetical protein
MNNPILALQEYNPELHAAGPFLVLDIFTIPQFVTNSDGEIKYFPDYDSACEEAKDCHEAFVVNI